MNINEFLIDIRSTIEYLDKADADAGDEEMKKKTPAEVFNFSKEAVHEFYQTSRSLFEQKRFQDALNAFTFLVYLNPNCSTYWFGLGMSAQMEHEWTQALQCYIIVRKFEPLNMKNWVFMCRCYKELGDLESAELAIEDAIQIFSEAGEKQALLQLKEIKKQIRE